MTGNVGGIGGLVVANLLGSLLPYFIERALGPKQPQPTPVAPPPYPPPPPQPGTPAAEFENIVAQGLRLPTAALAADVERAMNEVRQQLTQRGITGPAAAQALGEARQRFEIEATRAQADLARRAADLVAQYAAVTGQLPGGGLALPLYEFLSTEAMRRAEMTGMYEPPFDMPGAPTAADWRRYVRQREFYRVLTDALNSTTNQLASWWLLNMFRNK
jgi:hypothetical protein